MTLRDRTAYDNELLAPFDSRYKIGLEIAIQRFNEETQRRDSLDTKASVVLGFAGVILAICLTLISIDVINDTTLYLITIATSSALSFISAVCALLVMRVQDYLGGPQYKYLETKVADLHEKGALEQDLFRIYLRAYHENHIKNQNKAKLIRPSYYFLFLSGLLIFTVMALHLIQII